MGESAGDAGGAGGRRPLLRPLAAAAAAWGLALLLLPGGALAGFGSSFDVSIPPGEVEDGDVAVAPDGTAIFVWQGAVAGDPVIQARVREPDGSLGPVLVLSAAIAND